MQFVWNVKGIRFSGLLGHKPAFPLYPIRKELTTLTGSRWQKQCSNSYKDDSFHPDHLSPVSQMFKIREYGFTSVPCVGTSWKPGSLCRSVFSCALQTGSLPGSSAGKGCDSTHVSVCMTQPEPLSTLRYPRRKSLNSSLSLTGEKLSFPPSEFMCTEWIPLRTVLKKKKEQSLTEVSWKQMLSSS